MLRWRLLLGVGFTLALVGLCVADHKLSPPGLVLLPLVGVVLLAGAQELLALLSSRPVAPRPESVYGGTLLLLAANGLALWAPAGQPPLFWPACALALAVIGVFVREMIAYRQPGQSIERAALALLALLYLPWLMTMAIQLRGQGGGRTGVLAIASLVLVVKLADIGAYTVGRLLGRHKMSPWLSPGKTLEGAAGALGFAVLGAWFSCDWLMARLGPDGRGSAVAGWIAYGLAIALAGMAGDLAESLLKREAGQKDSSRWMPGFGGVLDLLDSILFAAPVAYLFWTTGIVGR